MSFGDFQLAFLSPVFRMSFSNNLFFFLEIAVDCSHCLIYGIHSVVFRLQLWELRAVV